jgi:uncharacterized protein (DUF433 family)
VDLPSYLEHADGEIRLTGHRIGLFHVVDRYQEGHSPEMIREELATLPLALIHRVIAFYLENQQEVDAYVADYRAELDRQEAAQPSSAAAVEIRKRLKARHRVESPTSQP